MDAGVKPSKCLPEMTQSLYNSQRDRCSLALTAVRQIHAAAARHRYRPGPSTFLHFRRTGHGSDCDHCCPPAHGLGSRFDHVGRLDFDLVDHFDFVGHVDEDEDDEDEGARRVVRFPFVEGAVSFGEEFLALDSPDDIERLIKVLSPGTYSTQFAMKDISIFRAWVERTFQFRNSSA